MCPYYLDGDHSEKLISPGERDKRSPDTRYIGYCAVFKVRRRGALTAWAARDDCPRAAGGEPVSQNSTACGRLTGSSIADSWRAPCQIRSTYLVADRARAERRGLPRTRGSEKRKATMLLSIGALWLWRAP